MTAKEEAEVETYVKHLMRIATSYRGENKEEAAVAACGLIQEHGLLHWDHAKRPPPKHVAPSMLKEFAAKFSTTCACGAKIPKGAAVVGLKGCGVVMADHAECIVKLRARI